MFNIQNLKVGTKLSFGFGIILILMSFLTMNAFLGSLTPDFVHPGHYFVGDVTTKFNILKNNINDKFDPDFITE